MSIFAEKVLCIVPARGGSKRLPRKNVAMLGGKPLLAWTLERAIKTGIFDSVWVSSEDDEVLETAKKWGGRPLLRPADLASDKISVSQVCVHSIREFAAEGQEYTALYVLLPTSPFRRSETIWKAWHAFLESGANTLLSVVPVEYPPQWTLIQKDGWLHPFDTGEYEIQRHNLVQAYRHDGGHAIARLPGFLHNQTFLGPRTVAFEVGREEAVDIDEPLDLAWAEFLLEHGWVPRNG